jgi:methionyl-tRNA synthetase
MLSQLHLSNLSPSACFWLVQGTDEEKAKAAEVLCVILETIRVAAVCLYPITPALSVRCFQQLGLSDEYHKVCVAHRGVVIAIALSKLSKLSSKC